MEEVFGKKKLSHCIERTKFDTFLKCQYIYKFSTSQWLENIDNLEYFGIDYNNTKQTVIDSLVNEFRIALNIFGDPAGKEYVESINK